jgi:inorganic triphosphatase YgiF
MDASAKGFYLMKADSRIPHSEEIELKLALTDPDISRLAKQLARSSILVRRKPLHKQLLNVYYDTPDQLLRKERTALRVRRVGTAENPQWLQTLKMGGREDSALSQRGEWEVPVPSGKLSLAGLKASPWSDIDPDGAVFQKLAACFSTNFDRTIWVVRRRDGSVVEVALDIGEVMAGDKRAPICELELELISGSPAALFDIARQIAQTVAVLPATMSKAQRGFLLADGKLADPLTSQPQALTRKVPVVEATQRVLREMFNQFTTNLNLIRFSDDPELVHQARVGWRRFRSALRLCRPVIGVDAIPSWQALDPLLTFLGELRDLDVARIETLPPLRAAYEAGDARRVHAWEAMNAALTQAEGLRRKSVRYALQDPAVGVALLSITQWLEGISNQNQADDAKVEPALSLQKWARQRIVRLHGRLKEARSHADTVESLHRVRILAKRMRYGIEAVKPLLTKHQAQHWYKQAASLQATIGSERDVVQAVALIAKLECDRGLVEFLRGCAVGQSYPK